MARMNAAAGTANEKVLLHPATSGQLGIESGRGSLETRRWRDAVKEMKDKVRACQEQRVSVELDQCASRARYASGYENPADPQRRPRWLVSPVDRSLIGVGGLRHLCQRRS